MSYLIVCVGINRLLLINITIIYSSCKKFIRHNNTYSYNSTNIQTSDKISLKPTFLTKSRIYGKIRVKLIGGHVLRLRKVFDD